MSDDIEKDLSPEKGGSDQKVERRDVLKGLATIPILGAFVYSVLRKQRYNRLQTSKSNIAISGPNSPF